MSQEIVRKFYDVLKTDEILQEQVKAANDSSSVVRIAAAKGYEFTEQELETVMQEVSEEELASVAGGLDRLVENCDSGYIRTECQKGYKG